MNEPLVSITSAFYNEAPHLLDMVKSVFAQTFTDWELILLDDGSTDNSLELARSIDDPRVRVFSNDKNIGRPASLNKITSLARGKYIARMDADDMCSPTRIEKQVRLIESDPKLDVVGTGICYLDKNDKPVGHRILKTLHHEICQYPERTIGLCHGSILGKKEWFQKYPYNEKLSYAIDYCVFLRAYPNSFFANVVEPLYYYRLETSFNLKKQFRARMISAGFLYKYCSKNRKYVKAILNPLQQYIKFLISAMMCAAGMKKKLLGRRYSPISEIQRVLYGKELDVIKSYVLPFKSQDRITQQIPIKKPLLTVGIPFYNSEKTLLNAVKSIFAQTVQDWELILFDDGSEDGSLELARSIEDPRVIVLSDGLNKKLPARLNQIHALARGKYIARMDADDLCSITRLEKQVEFMEAHPDVDVSGTGIIYLDKNDLPVGHYQPVPTHEDICGNPYRTFWLCHASVIAKKEWYKKNSYRENALCAEDYDLWLRTYQATRFANIPEPLYYYRLETSFSLKKQFRSRRSIAGILYEYCLKNREYTKAILYPLEQYIKFSVSAMMCAAGMKKTLLACRYSQMGNIDEKVYQKYVEEIKIIKKTKV
jgi:glycosyltransferase involved in cell wall biosynthesis